MTEKRALDSSSMCNGLPREDNFCNFRTLQAAIFLLQLQGGPMPISLAGSLGHLLPDLTNDSANFFYVICSQTKKKGCIVLPLCAFWSNTSNLARCIFTLGFVFPLRSPFTWPDYCLFPLGGGTKPLLAMVHQL